MINTKLLLLLTAIGVSIVYYALFTIDQIKEIVFDEYIIIGIMIVSLVCFIYFKIKLKDKYITEFIPNTNYVSLKSSIAFFLIFEVVDYFSEDGFIGMIKLWFSYWVFGVIAYLVTHIINFYKNEKNNLLD
jgi:hypothetical protein